MPESDNVPDSAVKTALYDRINEVCPKEIGVWGTEGMRLSRMAMDVPEGGTIVEIGSYHGRSAAFMASALAEDSTTKIYCIDVWANRQHMLIADNALKELGLRKHIELIRSPSVEVAKTWNKPVDMLFIDGNHYLRNVLADFVSWLPHLKKGGLIAFHDYRESIWPDVATLVDSVTDVFVKETVIRRKLWTGYKL